MLRARLNVHLPGVPRDVAQSLVDAAHENTCPYSKITRGNIVVTISLVLGVLSAAFECCVGGQIKAVSFVMFSIGELCAGTG